MTYIPNTPHASDHLRTGADPIDGRLAEYTNTEANYTPSTSGDVDDVNMLGAHALGIDTALAGSGSTYTYLADATISGLVTECWQLHEVSGIRHSRLARDTKGLTPIRDLYEDTSGTAQKGFVNYDRAGPDATNIPYAYSGDGSSRLAMVSADWLGLDSGDWSFSVWVEVDDLTDADQDILSVWEATGDQRAFRLFFDTSEDKFAFEVSGDGTAGDTTTHTIGSGTISAGQWYHLHIYHDDGTEIGSQIDAATATTTAHTTGCKASTAPFLVAGGPGADFDGGIAQLAFCNTKLSGAQCTHIYNSGSGRALVTVS